MDICLAYNMLLRPWIHLTGVVPSTLHQWLKYVMNNTMVTVKAEEALWMTKNMSVPYIKINEVIESPFHFFEVVQEEFVSEDAPIPKPSLSRA